MYQYSFDDARVGDWRISRKKYELLQQCYKLLLDKIESWNETALKHGAPEPPYNLETNDLRSMIEWGERQLSKPEAQEILINGISVGSCRYAKAALLYGIQVREEEIAAKNDGKWPLAVIESLRYGIKPLRDLADKISYPPADIFNEVVPENVGGLVLAEVAWDVFISHSSEDKQDFVRPLAEELQFRRLNVWYDDFTLTVGDSLRRSIDRGLVRSRYGIVVLSPSFFAKDWPQRELDGLIAREVEGHKVILPVWHNIDREGVRLYSPMLADRLAVSSGRGVKQVADALIAGMGSRGDEKL